MAFVRVKKIRTGHVSKGPVATMGAYLADGKVHKSKSVMFRISRELIDQLKWETKDDKLHVSILEGTDTDAGFLQLINDPDNSDSRRVTLRSNKIQGISINAMVDGFKHYVLNECPVSAHSVTHTIDGEALIIECPDWFRYNASSVPQPEPKPSEKVVDMHPGRGRRRQRG